MFQILVSFQCKCTDRIAHNYLLCHIVFHILHLFKKQIAICILFGGKKR